MRLLFVVQRYGADMAGGAEAACRELATRLVGRGHEVEVLTSCATSYVDWANATRRERPSTAASGCTGSPVDRPRDNRASSARSTAGRCGAREPNPVFLQREWMRCPGTATCPAWCRGSSGRRRRFDVAVFVTYLYATTWAGLPVAAGLAPTVLLPAAHDEPPFWLPLFDLTLRLPTRLRVPHRGGAGADGPPDAGAHPVDGDRDSGSTSMSTATPDGSATEWGLGDRPYLLYVGRLDPGKGSDELFDYFTTYKARHPGDLALAVVGEPVKPLPAHPDVVTTGWVDEQVKVDAVAGCAALVMPSYFESFSLVLVEAWAQRRPALVNGRCEVLLGQAHRSGGGLPYRGYAEFEAAVDS